MEDYIKNILPRIRRFSNQLSSVESFIEKPWIKYDINSQIEYTFERNNRLIIAINGDAKKEGKWELLSTGKLLLKKEGGDELLEPKYIDETIFILSKPNQNIQLFVKENNKNINIENYLNNILNQKELLQRPPGTDFTGLIRFTLIAILLTIIFVAVKNK